MRRTPRAVLTVALLAAAFAGGALTAEVGHATTGGTSPYSPLGEVGRVLVFVENYYVDPVARDRLLDGAIHGMVAELDPHSGYMDPAEFKAFSEETEGSFAGVGVEVDYRDGTIIVLAPIDGSPAALAGIRSGDEIVAVDGRPLRGLPVERIVELMRGPAQSRVRLSVRRTGAADVLQFELVRAEIHVPSVEGKLLHGGIGYLRLKQFQSGTHDELLAATAALRQASSEPLGGVVLDLRNNPGGLVDEAEAVADELLDGGVIYSTRHRGRILDESSAHRGGALAKMPVALLVNEYSASSAELVAGALQDHGRAVVVGGRTFGKGSVQTIFELPAGAGLRLTTMRYYTPLGHAIQAAGIAPDVAIDFPVDPTAAFDVMREDSLDGHLAAERPSVREPRRRVAGGERPVLGPIDKVPTDPRAASDVALREAYREVTDMRAKQAAEG